MISPALKPGNVVRIGARASVQFGAGREITMRITKVQDWPTYHGWCWLTGYVLDHNGEATDRRDVFVQCAGIRHISAPTPKAKPPMHPAPLPSPIPRRRPLPPSLI